MGNQIGRPADMPFSAKRVLPALSALLEVALTSGGVDKLDIYRRFEVREVWFWRLEKLEVFALNQAGRYEGVSHSELLPALALIDRCVAVRSWQKARQAFRAALATAGSSESP